MPSSCAAWASRPTPRSALRIKPVATLSSPRPCSSTVRVVLSQCANDPCHPACINCCKLLAADHTIEYQTRAGNGASDRLQCRLPTHCDGGRPFFGAGGGEAGSNGTEVDVEAEEREVLSMACAMGVGLQDVEQALLDSAGNWELVLQV